MLPKFISRKGHILNMVFTAQNNNDIETILKFCDENGDQGFPLISFCMGEIGKPTRKQSITRGAAYTYAYIRKPTAHGQVHISDILES